MKWKKVGDGRMQPRIILLDIEVLQEGTRFPNPDEADRPIICYTIYDNYLNKFITIVQRYDLKYTHTDIEDNWCVVKVSNEIDLLKIFIALMQRSDPDIVVSWNTDFDVKYLVNRLNRLDFSTSIFDHVQVFDMLSAYKRIKNIRSYTLGYVAKVEGITHKTESASDIPWLYENDLDRLIKYNYTDTLILKELEDKVGVISMYWQMKSYVGVPDINDCFHFSVLLDTVLLRLAKKRGVCLPSKQYDNENKGFEGAIVFDPIPGIHSNVITLDMSRFYPSIVLSLNISPEIYKNNYNPKQDVIGIVPEMVMYLMEERKYYEKQMKQYTPGTPEYELFAGKRQVVKDLLNAVWGFLGYERSRIYVQKLAALTTKTAREGLLWVKEQAEKEGYSVIYGDTDSIFIKLPYKNIDELVEKGRELADKITRSFDQFAKEKLGLDEHQFAIDFEKVFDTIFFIPHTKKRYAGRCIYEKGKETDYILIRGLEVRRTDTSEITVDLQYNVIEMILHRKSNDEIIGYIRDIVNKIKNGSVDPRDLAISKGIQRRINSYGVGGKALPFHIRAAIYSNRNLGTRFDKGDKIKILYVKRISGLPRTDVIAFTDDMKLPDMVIDYDKMIDVTVRSKVEKLLALRNIHWSDILGQHSLLSFSR